MNERIKGMQTFHKTIFFDPDPSVGNLQLGDPSGTGMLIRKTLSIGEGFPPERYPDGEFNFSMGNQSADLTEMKSPVLTVSQIKWGIHYPLDLFPDR